MTEPLSLAGDFDGPEAAGGDLTGRVDVPAEDFEGLVADAMDSLPDWVLPVLGELAVLVQDEEPPATRVPGRVLLGQFRGIPRTRYGSRPPGTLPDTITLYRLPILSVCRSSFEVPARIRTVLLHELGHAVGLEEPRLRELGVC